MNIHQQFIDLLACPLSGEALSLNNGELISELSGESYPLINNIPWLLPNAQNSLQDWGGKLNHFNQTLVAEIQSLQAELASASKYSSSRIETLIAAKKQFLRRVSELVLPVVASPAAKKEVYDALRDRAPNIQNLLSYEANLYRDWVWGSEENAESLSLVLKMFGERVPQKIMVAGAGACRLALDIHEHFSGAMTVANDINPLLLLAANHLLNGKPLPIVEFPMQPRKSEFVALSHDIKGLDSWPENFHLAFCDVNKPAFKPGCFDAVITPWFIDIQPLELGRFLRQLNGYLPSGGIWVNFGSLVFNQKRDAYCYSIEEVQHIAAENGFEIEVLEENLMPYLKSPYNAGHRMEHVWAWRAIKKADVPTEQNPQNLPEWLLDLDQVIPNQQYFKSFSLTHSIYASLATEVNGKLSIAQIARKIARVNQMDEQEALRLVRNFFADLYLQYEG